MGQNLKVVKITDIAPLPRVLAPLLEINYNKINGMGSALSPLLLLREAK